LAFSLVSCLSQNSEGMVLDDADAQSLVNQLTSGSTLDLMNQIGSTTMAGGGATLWRLRNRAGRKTNSASSANTAS
jgi:hypothetical protein